MGEVFNLIIDGLIDIILKLCGLFKKKHRKEKEDEQSKI